MRSDPVPRAFGVRSGGRCARPRAAALIAGALALAALQAAADTAHLYRWTDRDGHVHYGDVPAQNSVEVNPRMPVAAEAASAGPKINAEECERRRKEADSYRNAGKVTETNNLGEIHEYSDAEKAKLVERADNAAHVACGEAAAPSRER